MELEIFMCSEMGWHLKENYRMSFLMCETQCGKAIRSKKGNNAHVKEEKVEGVEKRKMEQRKE